VAGLQGAGSLVPPTVQGLLCQAGGICAHPPQSWVVSEAPGASMAILGHPEKLAFLASVYQ
jgi:hypothetical protein